MKKILIVLTVAIYVINFLLFIISHSAPLSLKRKATVDIPYFFEENIKYLSNITDVVECGDCLYVMYDNKNILTCHDLQGGYICSYYFDMSRNGKSQIYHVDETLYLEARGHNIYEFINGRFVAFYDSEKDTQEINNIREKVDHSQDSCDGFAGRKYVLKGTSVFCVLPDGSEVEVLSRPEWYIFFQNDILFLIVNLATLAVAYLVYKVFSY